jgi:hypothetical protein
LAIACRNKTYERTCRINYSSAVILFQPVMSEASAVVILYRLMSHAVIVLSAPLSHRVIDCEILE